MKPRIALSFLLIFFSAVIFTNNSQAADNPVEIKLAYTVTKDGTDGLALQHFSEMIKEKTNGKYIIKHFPNGQLGNEREITESMKIGSVDMAFTGFAPVSWYAPEYECLDAPFVLENYEHMDRVYKGELIQEVNGALLKKQDIKVLDYWYRGPRNITSNKPINSVSDMAGFKIRVPETPLFVEAFKLLGANPTPIAFKELFLALKQGIVDGQENPLELIYTNSFYEAQKYVVRTEHIFGTHILMMSNRLFKSLPEDLKKIFQESAMESGEYQLSMLKESEANYEKLLKENGMQFIEVDRDAFKARLGDTFASKFKERWKPGFYEAVIGLK